MELHQLRYFVAVAETGNFTRAAERCRVAQPSLSQQIAKLEGELGHKLFHRLGRRAVLTEAGGTLLERARRILFDVDNTTHELRDDPALGRAITVGAIPTVAPYLLPQLINRCRTLHPHLTIHTREDFRGPLLTAVAEGELDLALANLPVADPRLSVEPLFTEPLLLVVGLSHRLARATQIHAPDLAEETFVMLGDTSWLTMQIHRFCGAHEFEPRIGYRCAQVATVKALVAEGVGIAILPQVTRLGHEDRARLLYKPLAGRAPTREIAIVRHQLRYQSRGAQQFLTVLREAIFAPATPFPGAQRPG